MQVAFRADASLQIETGHIMRCLTLADALRSQGAECLFVCRAHDGNMIEFIAGRGYQIIALPKSSNDMPSSTDDLEHSTWLGVDWLTDAQQTHRELAKFNADWLIIDHYAIDFRWETELRCSLQKDHGDRRPCR